MSIPVRLENLRMRISEACAKADRDPSEVRLLAASKGVLPERIIEALEAGHTLFGESRAQSLRDKSRELRMARPTPEWHFIGHLQRNKIKYLVGCVSMIHTVDRLELGNAIAHRIRSQPDTAPMPILVEVNLGSEWSKSGVEPEEALELCHALDELPEISLRGLMAIPPWHPDPDQSCRYFEQLALLAREGRDQGLALHELSMGMSHDFEQAIAHGATFIRLGTSIFGPRPPRAP